MLKKARKILLILLISIIILISGGLAFTYIYSDEIKQYGVEQINQLVNCEIEVEEIEFSVFKRFPDASLEFKNIRAMEPDHMKSTDELFNAEYFFMEFDVIQLIRGNYEVKKLAMENGEIRLRLNKEGLANYDVLKSDEMDSTDFTLGLNEIGLVNMKLNYENEIKGIELQQVISKASANGNFSRDFYDMKVKGYVNVDHFTVDKNRLINKKDIFLNVKFSVDSEKDLFAIDEGALSVNDLHFFLNGDITQGKSAQVLNLKVSGNHLSLNDLIRIVPGKYQEYLSAYKAKGEVNFNASIRGTLTQTVNPEVNVNFSVTDAVIKHPKTGMKLSKVGIKGVLNNGSGRKMRTTSLVIDDIYAEFKVGGGIKGSYTLTDFEDPVLSANLDAWDVHLYRVAELMDNDSIVLMDGLLDMQFSLKGKVKDLGKMTIAEFRNAQVQGKAELRSFKLKHLAFPYPIDSMDAILGFNNNDVLINEMYTEIGKNDLSIKGYFQNLIPFILEKNQKLYLKADYYAEYLNWKQFMFEEEGGQESPFNLPDNIAFDLNANIQKFEFRDFSASDLKGRLRYNNRSFSAQDVSFNSMEGTVLANLLIDGTNNRTYQVKSEANIQKVDITRLFSSFEQFGQEEITSKNLKGICSAEIAMTATFDRNWKADNKSIYAQSHVIIEKGELVDYRPVYSLSKFISVEELNQIKFHHLENDITIRDEKIIIPNMNIRSSAINLNISGMHGFNNEIEYHFNVLLRDILSKKARKANRNNEEFGGQIEDDGLGRTTLFLKMTGTVDDPKISYDRKGLRNKWKEDLAEEKQTIKQILKEEFGGEERTEEKKDYEFELEWEDETNEEKEEDNDQIKQTKQKEKSKDEKKKKSWLDKITEPNEEEYEDVNPNDL